MFRLRMLGGFALEGPSETLAPLSSRRAEAVLAVLAVCGELGCTRERLMALLWPESDETQAGQGLRDALHAIRRALGPGAVVSSGRTVRLDQAVVHSDALSFAEAMASGRHADAVRAYGGTLLDGFHINDARELERWLEGERARLAREYGDALRKLAVAAELTGAWDEAAGWWERAVHHDPLNSRLVLLQVRALAAIGDRAGAIKAADAHARRLRDELDLEPDREVLARIEQIRRGELPALQGGVPDSAPVPWAEPSDTRVPLATAGKGRPRRLVWAAATAVVVVLLGAFGAARLLKSRAPGMVAPRTAVAVLPFRNLSPDSSSAFFAGGLHDELLTQLTKVASLRVVGWTSVRGYDRATKPLRQIGEELAVGSVVEASVQVVGNRLRINVQLHDPRTETLLWAEGYDRTLDDAFAVQSDIAQRIVSTVGATLTGAEAGAIKAAPTSSPAAYQLYLQGRDYHRRPGIRRENLLIAQQLYERALAVDTGFALAHAAVSFVHVAMYGLRYDRSAARLELAQREADIALRLAPDLPQAHLAFGARRHARGSYREALDEFNRGLQGAPNDAELWVWVGRVQRNLGNWDAAFAAFARARSLDPRDADLLQSIGGAYHYLRRYPEAIEAYRQAFLLAPDMVQARLSLAWSYVVWKGELDTLRAVLQDMPLDGDPGSGGGPVGDQRLVLLLWERRPDSLLSLLRVMHRGINASARASLFRASWAARAHTLLGDTAAARANYDSMLVLLNAERRLNPDDEGVHAGRGSALAALGLRADALREVEWLERFDAYPRNQFASGSGGDRARILVRLGETDAALDEIERMLARPSLLSVHELRLSPDFDPLRSNPRFQALLHKYATP